MDRPQKRTMPNYKQMIYLHDTCRMLWIDHMIWTQFLIISTTYMLHDLSLVKKRLVKTSFGFANEIQKYYGVEKSIACETVLTAWIGASTKYIASLKAKGRNQSESLQKKWKETASAVSAYLADLNPNWKKEEWDRLLSSYQSTLEKEAKYRFSAQHTLGIEQCAQTKMQVYQIADYMAEGLYRQFVKTSQVSSPPNRP